MSLKESALHALELMGYAFVSALPVMLYGIFLVWLFRKNLRR